MHLNFNKLQKIVAIGGNGFIGKALKSLGHHQFTAISRTTTPSLDISKEASMDDALGSMIDKDTIVINMVGILQESRNNTFESVQLKGLKNIVDLVQSKKCKKFIQLSAIGANKASNLPYFKTKGLAEEYILNNLANSTILRPSIVFGPDDSFFNRFSRMSNYMPVFPLINGGISKFQPIYVKDLVDVIESAISNPLSNNKIYEVGGPDQMTYKDIIDLVLKSNKKKRYFVNVPASLMAIPALFFERLPSHYDFVITRDQIKQLLLNNVCGLSTDCADLEELGIVRKTFAHAKDIVPTYIK